MSIEESLEKFHKAEDERMAREGHLNIINQGVAVWNKWRLDYPNKAPWLVGANLAGANLTNADFRGVRLMCADLRGAILSLANFSPLYTKQFGVDVSYYANLTEANLSGAFLEGADMLRATLTDSNLSRTQLIQTIFIRSYFHNTNMSHAVIDGTIFVDDDLSAVNGLETILHRGPSSIGIDTFLKSQGNIPEAFLRGCGVPDTFITFAKSLVGKAIDYYSAFISYSSKNTDIAERLHADLQSKGVRCWFAPEDIKIGDKFRQRIDEALRVHDKLLVILSEESISSAWVEEEVESAIEREHREKRLVLFPVRIDDAVINSDQAWAASLRRMRHIGDFSGWKDHDSYSKAFERLLRDLKAEV